MSLAADLWTYQAERFPLKKVMPLLAVFSAASVTVSAVLAARPPPGWDAYAAAFALVLILFFQMRVCDEVKDLEDDRRYRPERPIPRGLVSLRMIVGLGLATVPIAALIAIVYGHGLIWLLLLVWAWLAAMTFEFGVPAWLKARPWAYLLSHMAIMPLIDLMLTGAEWLPSGGPVPGLWLFLALSFANGVVLELGRKIWSPDSERPGVETYSALWGPRRAVAVWLGFTGLSLLLLIGVGLATGTTLPLALLGLAGLAACLWAARVYLSDPTPAAQKRIDTIAGLWVFLCYAAAGFGPLVLRGIP
ncbi:MAG: UbiA family prenyltransferase [Pseudomonadota bacterium]